jgi:hypothetical protein
MNILSFISGIFSPVERIIDEINVSDEERLKLRNELARIQADMQAKSVELMAAEAKSEHWIVAAWRPICALCLFGLILLDGFKFVDAPQQVYNLAELFLGVYGGGRSLEKIAKVVKS